MDPRAHTNQPVDEKRQWVNSIREVKHNDFCPRTSKFKWCFANVATDYPVLPIDNLTQMLTAFGTTSHAS